LVDSSPAEGSLRVVGEVPCPIHDPLRRPWRGTGKGTKVLCCCPGGRRAYERIYSVIERIPRGRVATYGEIAQLAGLPGRARQVGYALRVLPEEKDLPWHRVVNAKGEVSGRSDPRSEGIQRVRLRREGIVFAKGRIPLRRFGWDR